MKDILAPFGAVVGLLLAIALLLYLTQNRAARAGRFFGGVLIGARLALSAIFRIGARHRLQRRVNKIIESGSADRPFLTAKCRIRWQNPNVTRDEFMDEKRFVILIPKDYSHNESLIETVYIFVSRSLLARVKRFLSDSQREAVNLYFTAKMLHSHSPSLAEQFNVDYIPEDLNEKSARYLATFDLLERYALFEDLFVRELDYMGGKVGSLATAPQLSSDVDALVDLLKDLTERQAYEALDLVLERTFIRCGILLIGRREKISPDMKPYVDYVRLGLLPRQIDSVYVLADSSKSEAVQTFINEMSDELTLVRSNERPGTLLGRFDTVCIAELRNKQATGLGNGAVIGGDHRFTTDEQPNNVIDLRGRAGMVTGVVKFVTDEGWGFIEADDPSISKDVWFTEDVVTNRPPIFGQGDKVALRLVRDDRRDNYRAGEVVVLLGHQNESARVRAALTSPAVDNEPSATAVAGGSHAIAPAPSVRYIGNTLPNEEQLSEIVANILQAEADMGNTKVMLAIVGYRLRARIADFSPPAYDRKNLINLMTDLSRNHSRFYVDRLENGHPYLSLEA